jgi:hypothetical protein
VRGDLLRGAAHDGTVVVGVAKTLDRSNNTCMLVGRRARLARNRAKGCLYFYFPGRRKKVLRKDRLVNPQVLVGLWFSRVGPFPGLVTGVGSRIGRFQVRTPPSRKMCDIFSKTKRKLRDFFSLINVRNSGIHILKRVKSKASKLFLGCSIKKATLKTQATCVGIINNLATLLDPF